MQSSRSYRDKVGKSDGFDEVVDLLERSIEGLLFLEFKVRLSRFLFLYQGGYF